MKDLTQTVLLQGSLHDGLYKFHIGKPLSTSDDPATCLHAHSSVSTPPSFQDSTKAFVYYLSQWHSRLGHPTMSTVKNVLLRCNIPFPRNESLTLCSSCQLGKSHRLLFSQSNTSFSAPFELICMNIWGPSNTLSRNGSRANCQLMSSRDIPLRCARSPSFISQFQIRNHGSGYSWWFEPATPRGPEERRR